MTPFIIIAAALLLAAAVTFVFRRRAGTGGLDGVRGFRRHMDALSSEARRDVIGRLQSNEWPATQQLQTRGIAGQPGVGGRMNAEAHEPAAPGVSDDVTEAVPGTPDQQRNGEGTEAKG